MGANGAIYWPADWSDGVTTNADTAALYEARIRSLKRTGPHLNWADGRAWAQAIGSRGLAIASLKSYASAVRWTARSEMGASARKFIESFDAALKPIQTLARATDQRVVPKRRRPVIDVDIITALRKAAERRSSSAPKTPDATFAVDLAEGTLRFGLRPSEWAKASIKGDRLSVLNGKFIDTIPETGPFADRCYRRGNGRVRALELSSDFSARFGELCSRLTQESRVRFRGRERSVRRSFRETVRVAIREFGLPERYRSLCLYDFRHQFSANWKEAEPVESGVVAALMGHISTTTATRSYAPRRASRGKGWGLRPTAETLAAVSIRDAPHNLPDSVVEPLDDPTITPDRKDAHPRPSLPSGPSR